MARCRVGILLSNQPPRSSKSTIPNIRRLQHGSWFNAPWGVVLTPGNFGEFSHAILVGQFRDGTIAAFNPVTGRFMGNVLNPDSTTFTSSGLWALRFGAGNTNSGSATTL